MPFLKIQIYLLFISVTNPSVFLSEVKKLPILEFGNMTYRVEYEEPSDDDEIIRTARKEIGETKEVIETAKKELVELLESKK